MRGFTKEWALGIVVGAGAVLLWDQLSHREVKPLLMTEPFSCSPAESPECRVAQDMFDSIKLMSSGANDVFSCSDPKSEDCIENAKEYLRKEINKNISLLFDAGSPVLYASSDTEINPDIGEAKFVEEATAQSTAAMKSLGLITKRLLDGKIVMDPPNKMTVGDTRIIAASVGVDVPISRLRMAASPAGEVLESDLKTSYEMSAKLVGVGFEIEPLSPEEQHVVVGQPTTWQWKVTAQTAGEQIIHASAYARLPYKGAEVPVQVSTFSRSISVAVRPQTWGEWAKSIKDDLDAVSGLWTSVTALVALVFGGVFGSSLRRGLLYVGNSLAVLPKWIILAMRRQT